jgi:1-acyl-sn-glycerol-3-phosphate acyltransferase
VVAWILRPPLMVLTKRDWHGSENLPKTGPVIVASNHTTEFDPLVIAHFMYDNGRIPRILAKASLFKVRGLGRLLNRIGQIPVSRGSRDAALAFRGAIDALNEGDALLFYVEGTITKDPDLWPMTGKSGAKTGAARVALTTGAPVVPVAQWGAHEILAPYGRRFRFFPRKTIHILAGPPVDLSDLQGREQTAEVLRTATDRIMTAITTQLGELRGEVPPAARQDPELEAAVEEPPADRSEA